MEPKKEDVGCRILQRQNHVENKCLQAKSVIKFIGKKNLFSHLLALEHQIPSTPSGLNLLSTNLY